MHPLGGQRKSVSGSSLHLRAAPPKASPGGSRSGSQSQLSQVLLAGRASTAGGGLSASASVPRSMSRLAEARDQDALRRREAQVLPLTA